MKKKIPVLILIYVSLALISMKCDGNKTTAIDVNKVCSSKVDSVNNYWHDVVKNLIIPDTVYLVGDSTAIHWIDSVSIRYIDSVRYTKGKLVEIIPDIVKTDTIVNDNLLPKNLIDNISYISKSNKGTRFAAPGYPHWILLKFNKMTRVDSIAFNVYGWDEGYTHRFIIYNFSDTLLSAETKPIFYSGHKINFYGTQLMIEITGGINNWTDIGDIKVFGYKL